MKAIYFNEFGSSKDDFAALQLGEFSIPEIKDNEVLVKMVAASINPGDFLFIQNLYPEPKKPVFPRQIAGNYGAGIITKAGKEVSYRPGTLVTFGYFNTWSEYAAVPAEWVIPLPSDYPIEKAAQFFNLITAWDLLKQSKVQSGQWLALTAGNSNVATMVSQLAKHRGINVISIVRKTHEHLDLKELGASHVYDLSKADKNIKDFILEITQNKGLNGVIDAVGGPVTGDLIQSLSFGGQVVIYGNFSSEKFELHNYHILMNNIGIHAYLYRYFLTPPEQKDQQMLQAIIDVTKSIDFQVSIGRMHPLEDFKTAIYESLYRPEYGKRFFKFPH
ncbi:zinc-dependent alcohol dehydrogenase family protein [Shimazuella sp. AN120528]|uniref:quinone oxidoreductase family protein n=1 Tax=Shimazuella soli TaxID=1892854 RepID=UPI001F0D9C3E|nr:zinc-dependent alcohol dehydrogenase family protein [Shimazuella soli]MCH5583445.1 zinc-dependent alcohol dehydrogenase family protein [Shimazuella soli]